MSRKAGGRAPHAGGAAPAATKRAGARRNAGASFDHARDDATSAPFDVEVAKVVRAIPRGAVLSYGDVARRAGAPRAARAVARALSRQHGLPWWRVIRADGTLAEAVADEQARLLRAEGVTVEGKRVSRR